MKIQKLFNLYADNKNPNSKSYGLRIKRFNLFLKKLNVDQNTKILDVGGTKDIWKDTGLKKNVTLLNIKFLSKSDPNFTYVEGDACDMSMFKDQEFDVIFSNSVIEHVGNYSRQKSFAEEIKRVGKKYWVQTPYKHFPIEPHFVFPLFQYLPWKMKVYIGLKWRLSHFKISNSSDNEILQELERLRLLNKKEMRELFKNSIILDEKYLGLIKSLIAVNTSE